MKVFNGNGAWRKYYEVLYLFLFRLARSLPPLVKKYVLRLLYIDVPVTAKLLQEWELADGSTKHKVAIDRLIWLRVIEVVVVDRLAPAVTCFIILLLTVMCNSPWFSVMIRKTS